MTRMPRLAALASSLALGASALVLVPQAAQAAPAEPTIDLLVVYTAAAEKEQGGQAGIEDAIQDSADGMNRALDRSDIDGSVKVVHTVEVDRVSNGKQGDDLNWLSKDPAIKELRTKHKADLVSLVVPGGAGLASVPGAKVGPGTDSAVYSVVGGKWLRPNEDKGEAGVFAHELGHNLGATHDWDTSPNKSTVYPYNHGFVSPKGNVDIMAYNNAKSCAPDCQRVPYYANPALTVEGEKFGTASGGKPSDLKRLFDETIPKVAEYR